MAEVFQGTPAIVNVTISDQEGKKVEYNICGRELGTVKDAVRKALEGIPDEDQNPTPKKARKPRRTKAELAASQVIAEATPDTGTPPPHRKAVGAWKD